MKKYELIIENEACWGCKACEAACMQEYHFKARYLRLGEEGALEHGAPNFMYKINVCKQCADPICVTACPERAISKKENDLGLVYHDKEKCNGCNAATGKSNEDKQETSPCKFNCPAKNNVQGFVTLAGRGRFEDALEIIKETNPFPSICGRVCHHPCESECNRRDIDQAVSIRDLERFIADQDLQSNRRRLPSVQKQRQEKIAVIGSGPAGMSCAYYLARDGYPVTIFEKAPVLGGMLVQGIPAYRLPREVVAAEIRLLADMGVTMQAGVEIGRAETIAGLRSKGFQAFFLAVGTQKCLTPGIQGENLPGVYAGLDYLKKINLGEKVPLGKNAAIIGGGNTALDAVRSARRLGADNAFILYRRGLEEMPANPEEVAECRAEGVAIQTLTQPVRFIEKGGRVQAVECVRMRLAEPDSSGRPKPEPIKGSEFTIPVDAVINALGQEADWACLTPECACTLTDEGGTLKVEPRTLQTSEPDLFAGGDAIRGPRTVVEAIADGREAAVSIRRYIEGEHLWKGRERRYRKIVQSFVEHYDRAQRALACDLDPKERIENFTEVQKGLEKHIAVQEGLRCLSCGMSCSQSCPHEAVTFDEKSGTAAKCNLCYERVENGLYPACADNVCLAHCVYFGDPVEIRKIIDQKRSKRQALY